jgi:hypothetical protein
MVGSCFLVQFAVLCVLSGTLRPFTCRECRKTRISLSLGVIGSEGELWEDRPEEEDSYLRNSGG